MTTNFDTFCKDPDERLDYSIDWSARLSQGEDIVSSTWDVDPGNGTLIVVTTTHGTSSATIWIEGGTMDADYLLTNHVTTDSSPARRFDRTIRIKIRQR
jgi:hypothetical protein